MAKVSDVRELLQLLPPDAEIYDTRRGEWCIWQGEIELARLVTTFDDEVKLVSVAPIVIAV